MLKTKQRNRGGRYVVLSTEAFGVHDLLINMLYAVGSNKVHGYDGKGHFTALLILSLFWTLVRTGTTKVCEMAVFPESCQLCCAPIFQHLIYATLLKLIKATVITYSCL